MLSRRRCMQAITFVAVELGLRSFAVATLTVTPNPVLPSTIVTAAGTGFAIEKTRLLLDGVVTPPGTDFFRPSKNGTFSRNITVSSTPRTQTLIVQQLVGPRANSAVWTEIIRTSIVVSIPPPPPGDTTAPVVSNLTHGLITETGCTVGWSLSEPATGWVEYGLSTAYGSTTIPETSFSWSNHSQPITGLSPNTRYYYRVKGADAAGNPYVTANGTYFTTLATTPPPPTLVISSLLVSSVTTTGATVSWSVSAAATGQVDYGLTSGYGLSTTPETSFISDHVQVITGLSSGTTYHFRVKSTDADGNTAESPDQSFTTSASSWRPFPAPVTTQTVNVPSNIDATGATDVAAVLNAFIAGVPDGRIISFPAGATYRLNQGIQFANRHNLIFEGNGATLRTYGAANDQLASAFVIGHAYGGFWDGGNTDIWVRNFVLIGNDPSPGVFDNAGQTHSAFEVDGQSQIEISGITSSAHPGDFAKIGDNTSYVWIHDNDVLSCGRNGISVISGSQIIVEANDFRDIGYYTFDVEPNNDAESCTYITFRNNDCISWGPEVGYGAGFLACGSGEAYLNIGNITVSGNRMLGSSNATLVSYVNQNQHRRLTNITITNNTSVQAGGVIEVKATDGLNIWGNLSAGVATSLNLVSCTAVDTTP